MLLLDREKTIIAVSQSACDILQISQAMLLGKPLTSCADGLFAQRDPTEVKPPMVALINISDKEVLAVTSKPITDATQQPAGWVISLHHASHQRKRYQRRTLPITPIVEGYCMRLQQQLGGLSQLLDSPDAHQQAIDQARQTVNQLGKRVQRLSLLQSLEAQGETDQEAIHVSTLVQPVFQKSRAALAQQGITLELAIDADISPLCCNINQVRLALHELIDNLALHASGATTAHIRVSQRHGYIYMHVEDNGCGIAWEAQQRIFEPFSRTQQPSYGSEHIGIGLAIARSVTAAHHGHLRIDSHRDEGCTVTLMLPVQH
jgi:signal transduction histidine kinase